MANFTNQRATFRKLHDSGCFVIPNPWDIGSARFLQSLGFQALATSSAGFAFSQGLPDSGPGVSRDLVLSHLTQIAHASDLPVNADFQDGYATSAEELVESVKLCIATGVSGFSIEDATGDSSRPLYEFDDALDRIRLVRQTIDELGADVMLTARSECFLVGHPDPLKESIRRLQAYAEAGADVLFAPGPGDREIMGTIIREVHPMPVNVIMSAHTGLTVQDIADLGARRISVGSALARSAWTGFIHSAKLLAQGSFEGLDNLAPFKELNSFFQDDSKARSGMSS